jgi:hypothetical protein
MVGFWGERPAAMNCLFPTVLCLLLLGAVNAVMDEVPVQPNFQNKEMVSVSTVLNSKGPLFRTS